MRLKYVSRLVAVAMLSTPLSTCQWGGALHLEQTPTGSHFVDDHTGGDGAGSELQPTTRPEQTPTPGHSVGNDGSVEDDGSEVPSPTHPEQILACSHFVDNRVDFDGDGSEAQPWNDVAHHVDELGPGDVMCIRGDISGSGRVYETKTIEFDSEKGNTKDGTADQPVTVRSYPGEKVVLRNVGNGYFVYLRGVDYWILEGLTLDNNGKHHWAINFMDGANHNILRNNEIHNGHRNGIVISRGCTDNTIENNHIHHFSHPEPPLDAHCVLVQVEADNTTIRQNTIHDCSGDGIQLLEDNRGSSDSDNVQIIENTFYRGTLAQAENAIDIKAATSLKVVSNEMFGYFDDSAIVVQKASQNILFEKNIIHDSARGFNIHAEDGGYPEGLILRNNLIYDITEYAVLISGVRGGSFVHNTIVNAQEYSLRVMLDGLIGGWIQNNLIASSGKAQLTGDVPFDDVTMGHNGWFDAEADDEFTDPTDVVGSGDPGFVDVRYNDYHLTADSPACDAGIDVSVTDDFESDPRPFGYRPDIGADEYIPVSHVTVSPDAARD